MRPCVSSAAMATRCMGARKMRRWRCTMTRIALATWTRTRQERIQPMAVETDGSGSLLTAVYRRQVQLKKNEKTSHAPARMAATAHQAMPKPAGKMIQKTHGNNHAKAIARERVEMRKRGRVAMTMAWISRR